MRYLACLILASLFTQPEKGSPPMNNLPLTMTVECMNNPTCTYRGEDIELSISLKNTSSVAVALTLAKLKRTGPYIKITDIKTGASQNLQVGLAPARLSTEFTQVLPQECVTISAVLTTSEIEKFRKQDIHLDVEVALSSFIREEGHAQPERFRVQRQLKIVGGDTGK